MPAAIQEHAPLLAACERKALDLLRANVLPGGILAAARGSAARQRGYDRVFARDAAICTLAMAYSGDAALEGASLASLETLARHQAANGQIAKYVDLAKGEPDFWYVGCIDASLWWLLALDVLKEAGIAKTAIARLDPAAARALAWLRAQEHPSIGLLQQNEASDWADIMPRTGFVLYSNALWYRVKRLYGVEGAELTARSFNELFRPGAELPAYKRLRLLVHYARRGQRNRELYLSYVNLAAWGEEGDVLGNVLAILCGLCDGARAEAILRAIARAQQGSPFPVRAVCDPIPPDHPEWRPYMARHKQNYAWQYHNGGIWPMVGGFWTAALVHAGMLKEAHAELGRLAQANQLNDWEFNEWLHGESGRPLGMPRQSWSAAGYLFAQRAITGGRIWRDVKGAT